MPVNPLDGLEPTPIALDRASTGGEPHATSAGPTNPLAGDGTGAAETNLRALADSLGVDPDELLAHLAAATAGAPPPSAGAAGAPPPSAAAAGDPVTTEATSETSSPAASAAAALLNRDNAANAWTSDLTQHHGGLLVDISV